MWKRAEKPQSDDLKLNLLENGLDFIREGIEGVYGGHAKTPRAMKFALLHMFAGTLLLLKERLRREHPSLIYKQIEKLDEERAATVDFDAALLRLEKVAKVTLPKHDLELLRTVQRERNQIEHFEVEIKAQHFDDLVGRLVVVVDRFLAEHLNESLHRHISFDAWDEVSGLKEIAERVEREDRERWSALAVRFGEMSDDELRALADVEDYHPKHNPDPVEPMECDSCGEETLIPVRREVAVCTNLECRGVARLHECPRCSRACQSLRAGFCTRCIEEIRDM